MLESVTTVGVQSTNPTDALKHHDARSRDRSAPRANTQRLYECQVRDRTVSVVVAHRTRVVVSDTGCDLKTLTRAR